MPTFGTVILSYFLIVIRLVKYGSDTGQERGRVGTFVFCTRMRPVFAFLDGSDACQKG